MLNSVSHFALAHVRCALAVVLLAAAMPSDAQTIRTEQLSMDAEAADLYVNAYRVQALGDGSRFVIYRSPVPREPSALAAALVSGDGAVTRMTVAEWIPPEELTPETIGQIYAASLSPDRNTLAVSIGWRHPKEQGTTAVAVLRRSEQRWRLSHLIRGLNSTGDLLLTGSGLLLALTADLRRAEATGTPPLLTVMSLDGRVVLEAFPTASADPDPSDRNRSRLGMSKGVYTLFDAERGQVVFFDLQDARQTRGADPKERYVRVAYASEPAVKLRLIKTVGLGNGTVVPPADAKIEDAHVYPDGTVAVVHSMLPQENDGVATLVTLHSPDGKSRSWHPDGVFFKPVFWENERLVGIARGKTPESDLIVNSVVFE